MVISSFEAKDYQAYYMQVLGGVRNRNGLIDHSFIRTGSGKFPLEYTNRNQNMMSWHLGSPDSGLPIPKTAIIERVRIQVTPWVTRLLPVGNEAAICFALMAPDGHWNRSRDNELHQRQGAASYSAPVVTYAMNCQVDNEVPTLIFVATSGTSPLPGGDVTDESVQTFGSTVFIPGGEQIGQVRVALERLDSPGTNPDLNVNMYSLYGNGRQYAPDALIATSSGIPYNDLSLGSNNEETFGFDPPIASTPEDRWLGFVLEGDWFTEANFSTHRIQIRTVHNGVQDANPEAGAGSMIYASKHADVQFENSFSHYYYTVNDVPVLFRSTFSEQELTQPFDRSFGERSQFNDAEPMVWIEEVPVSYGDKDFGADFSMTGDMANQIQNWVDSDHYDPDTGKYWLGMFLDRAGGVQFHNVYMTAQSTFPSPTLIVEWRPRRVNVV